MVNQRQTPAIDKLFTRIGTFNFDDGRATIVISNDDTDGYVVADAVQLLRSE